MLDVLIVGAGPAGLTAALYAARAGKTALVLEKMLAGGQAALTDKIENYPGFPSGVGGPELAMAMEAQATGAGAEIRYEAAQEIDCAGRRVRTENGWLEAKNLILALGAYPRKAGAVGEERLTGRGVSYCATCDGALYRGKRVVVVGGGNSAAEEAAYLADIGCEVLLVHRRDALRAEASVASRALSHPRVMPIWNAVAEAFEGEKQLERVILRDVNTGATREEFVAAAFVAIGRVPDTELVRGQIDMDAQGFLLAGEDCRASAPHVFAAGDARAKRLRQVATAVADGAIAASQLS